MSGTPDVREQDPALGGAAVDQGARSQQIDHEPATEDDVVEVLRRQLEELEGQSAEKEKALEAERRRATEADRARAEAEARARAADQQAREAQTASQRSTAEAQLDAVKNAIEANQGQMAKLKADYSRALSEGEFDKAAEVQAEMAVLGGKIVTLDNGRAALEERIAEAKTTPQDTERQGAGQQSPWQQREAYIQRYTPKVQEWLRGPNGERFFNDPAFQRRVMGAASYAENNKGLDNNSQEYIDFIETEVGLRQAAQPDNRQQQTQQQARGRDAEDRRMTAAPAGGSTAGSVRSRPDGGDDVYLTPSEKEQAARDGISFAEYARHKRDLLRENLIGPGARR